jgi:predicted nucleotidyltransferase
MHNNSREAVESRRRERQECLQNELQRMLVLLKQQPGVMRVILFGSLARGESGCRSDLDLVIVQDTTKRFMDRLDEMYHLLTPEIATDILVYTPSEWNTLAATRPFVLRVRREGKVLYESQAA